MENHSALMSWRYEPELAPNFIVKQSCQWPTQSTSCQWEKERQREWLYGSVNEAVPMCECVWLWLCVLLSVCTSLCVCVAWCVSLLAVRVCLAWCVVTVFKCGLSRCVWVPLSVWASCLVCASFLVCVPSLLYVPVVVCGLSRYVSSLGVCPV